MKFYQDNNSRRLYNYDNPLNEQGEFVLKIGTITVKGSNSIDLVDSVSLPKGESCLIGTGLRVNFGRFVPIFSHPHWVHLERWFVRENTKELMLEVTNSGTSKLTLEPGDEIASFVLVTNQLINMNRVNGRQEL
jgi:dUTPase